AHGRTSLKYSRDGPVLRPVRIAIAKYALFQICRCFQTMLSRPDTDLSAGIDTKLGHDVLQVVLGRTLRNGQLLSDLTVRGAVNNEHCDFSLASTQPVRTCNPVANMRNERQLSQLHCLIKGESLAFSKRR